jgi:hypothetical protein
MKFFNINNKLLLAGSFAIVSLTSVSFGAEAPRAEPPRKVTLQDMYSMCKIQVCGVNGADLGSVTFENKTENPVVASHYFKRTVPGVQVNGVLPADYKFYTVTPFANAIHAVCNFTKTFQQYEIPVSSKHEIMKATEKSDGFVLTLTFNKDKESQQQFDLDFYNTIGWLYSPLMCWAGYSIKTGTWMLTATEKTPEKK